MALTSSIQSPSTGEDTPTEIAPYRLDTSAVLIVRRPATTAQITEIRRSIEPRRGWWQFELQTWHYLVSVGSTAVAIAAFAYLLVTHGAVR